MNPHLASNLRLFGKNSIEKEVLVILERFGAPLNLHPYQGAVPARNEKEGRLPHVKTLGQIPSALCFAENADIAAGHRVHGLF